jgi:bifunctional non-homologous end joining protein LigD
MLTDVSASQAVVRVGRRQLELSRLNQRWWPAKAISKRDVVEYYATIAPLLLPHLRDRPFTIKRHYNGPRSPFEWIKDAPPDLPEWIATSAQPAKSRGGAIVRYPLVQDEAALLWLVNFGCIDLHVWSSRKDLPARPDYVLFDLDSHEVAFGKVVEAAQLLDEALTTLGLRSYVTTTGGDGLHVRVPVARRHTYEQARTFCRVVASALVAASDGLVTTARHREERKGVFIDAKMNGHGQQIVSVYSIRPQPDAAVAAPLAWDELTEELDPREFTMKTVLARANRLGDLHAGALEGKQLLARALESVDATTSRR